MKMKEIKKSKKVDCKISPKNINVCYCSILMQTNVVLLTLDTSGRDDI